MLSRVCSSKSAQDIILFSINNSHLHHHRQAMELLDATVQLVLAFFQEQPAAKGQDFPASFSQLPGTPFTNKHDDKNKIGRNQSQIFISFSVLPGVFPAVFLPRPPRKASLETLPRHLLGL